MITIKFALIGCGRIANRHIEAINNTPSAQLVAVCDRDQQLAKEKGALGKVPYYLDYQEMLAKHPEIDVITLLTPSGLHFNQAIDILRNYPKNLLIEKPFVMTTQQAYMLKKLADEQGVQIFPLYQNRFNKAVIRVKDAMAVTRELGKLRVGTVRVRWCRTQAYYDLSPWRGTFAMDGGAFTNQGIHFIDLLRYLCGEVKQVHAKFATLGASIEAEDTGVAIVEFESGALGVIEIMTSARPDDFEASISCVCEKGVAVIGGKASNELQIFSPDPLQEKIHSEVFDTVYGWGHDAVIKNIVDSLIKNSQPFITFEDGLKTIQLLHALYKSDEINGWVQVNNAGDSFRLGVTNNK